MTIAWIIGTDTEIGKTYSCCKIMQYLDQFKHQAATIKPIASGIELFDKFNDQSNQSNQSNQLNQNQLINPDVYQLIQHNTYHHLSLNDLNPFCFKEAIAPHLAAEHEGYHLSLDEVAKQITHTLDKASGATHLLLEGIGGLMVPLNQEETFLDLLGKLNHPIILVVGIKLGCLNHALLTSRVLMGNGLHCAGWIANQIDAHMLYAKENIDYLSNKLPMPILGTITNHGKLEPTNDFKELFQCYST